MTATTFIFLLTGIISCNEAMPSHPDVADSTLVAILSGLHLEDADLSIRYSDLPADSIPDRDRTARRDSVLSAHGVTEEAFDRSMEYYVRYPDAYVALYDKVLDYLNDFRIKSESALPSDSEDPAEIDHPDDS